MKVQELIEIINNPNERLCSIYDAENLITGITGDRLECVESNLNIDDYRWYTIATNVYKLEDGYVGIIGPSQLKSDWVTWSDCDYMCIAEEYEPVQTITYKLKR